MQHMPTPDTFAPMPDYAEVQTGGEVHVPALVVAFDGPQPTYPMPAASWTASSSTTPNDGSAAAAGGAHPARRRLVVRNRHATADLYVGTSKETCTPGGSSAYVIPAGQSETFTHKRAVMVCSLAGTPVQFSVMAEFEDGH